MPAQAGIQYVTFLGSRLRGNDIGIFAGTTRFWLLRRSHMAYGRSPGVLYAASLRSPVSSSAGVPFFHGVATG
jgi:hypothetical protein